MGEAVPSLHYSVPRPRCAAQGRPPSFPGPRCTTPFRIPGPGAQPSWLPFPRPGAEPLSSPQGCTPPLQHPAPPPGHTRELCAGPIGRMGRTNLRWEPTAAGKGGAECVAAARLMRAIQEVISWAVLRAEVAVCPQGQGWFCHLSPPPASCVGCSDQQLRLKASGFKSQKPCH